MVLLEVCVDSVRSAVQAEKGGAARVELCSALVEGGLTPSYGLVQRVREAVSIGLHVLVRPRSGDFLYSEEEWEVMLRDVQILKDLGVDGVVIGALKEDGGVDVARMREARILYPPSLFPFLPQII